MSIVILNFFFLLDNLKNIFIKINHYVNRQLRNDQIVLESYKTKK